MIEADLTPHKGDRGTVILLNYSLNETITDDARVKIYLNEYDPVDNGFDYNIDETLFDYFEVNPNNITPINLVLTDVSSGFYRICLRLAHNGSYYRDCDSGNQFLLIDGTPITININPLPMPIIGLSVEAPSTVFSGEEFFVNVSVSNHGTIEAEVRVYSYVYNSSVKLSEGAWDSNSENLTLSPGASALLTLSNLVNSEGQFILNVRAKHGKNVDVRKEISVVKKPVKKLFLDDLKLVNDCLRVTVSNAGYQEENISLSVYSSRFELKQNITLGSRSFYEEFIEFPDDTIYIFLYSNGVLIDEDRFELKGIDNGTEVDSTVPLIESVSNESVIDLLLVNESLLNESPADEQPLITGMQVINTGFFDTEILLYPIIILISLVALSYLLWKT